MGNTICETVESVRYESDLDTLKVTVPAADLVKLHDDYHLQVSLYESLQAEITRLRVTCDLLMQKLKDLSLPARSCRVAGRNIEATCSEMRIGEGPEMMWYPKIT